MVTIEVTNKTKQIVQRRGKLNRAPTSSESNLIHKWALDNGLTIRRWC